MARLEEEPVVVVGAGLAGLACANHLHQSGVPIAILDSSDRVGGRIATDEVDGFLLDRGFQVFLTAYPEAASVLDYDSLSLRGLYPGALVQVGERRYRFADPWKKPLSGVAGLFAPIATFGDAWRILRLRSAAIRHCDQGDESDATTTNEFLKQHHLSKRVMERFFRPFFGGVFLDPELETPSAFFRFVFSMFAKGAAALPAEGMQALPKQLASMLPPESIRLRHEVSQVASNNVTLSSSREIRASAVVVATDADVAARLTKTGNRVSWNGTTTLYYDAPRSPINENSLVLNGNGRGLVNHICVPSDVVAGYAPPGRALISVSLIGVTIDSDDELSSRVSKELGSWFGDAVNDWRLLRIYRIRQALPRHRTAQSSRGTESDGVVICGDHTQDPSINGALLSGRRAAEAVIAKFKRKRRWPVD